MRIRLATSLAFAVVLAGGLTAACGPKEGSPEWCDKMANTPKAQWTPHQSDVYGEKCAAHETQKQIDNLLHH